jgi:hypothetical protein
MAGLSRPAISACQQLPMMGITVVIVIIVTTTNPSH